MESLLLNAVTAALSACLLPWIVVRARGDGLPKLPAVFLLAGNWIALIVLWLLVREATLHDRPTPDHGPGNWLNFGLAVGTFAIWPTLTRRRESELGAPTPKPEQRVAQTHESPVVATADPQSRWLSTDFTFHSPESVWIDSPGVYIFAAVDCDGLWLPVYIGATESLATSLAIHPRWTEASQLGATHIHARVERDPETRARLAHALLSAYQPALNLCRGEHSATTD